MDLTTERLQLSAITPGDLEAIHTLHSLPETDRYNTMGIPSSIEETRLVMENWLQLAGQLPPQRYVFGIRTKANTFIGVSGINVGRERYRDAEIWYKLHPDHWNQGYATEMVKALLGFCFGDLQLHRVGAGCATENIGSVKVLEKTGFQREGHCRKKLPIRGEWMDNYEYAILAEDYRTIVNESPFKIQNP